LNTNVTVVEAKERLINGTNLEWQRNRQNATRNKRLPLRRKHLEPIQWPAKL